MLIDWFPVLNIVNVLVDKVSKFVQSVATGVVSPSLIDSAFPWISISGAIPRPWMENEYGFSSKSLFIILIVAVLIPFKDGLNATVNVVVAPANTNVDGSEEIVKSEALIPENEIAPIVKLEFPMFWIVKIWDSVVPTFEDPKSVKSIVEGMVFPFIIVIEFPKTLISGVFPVPCIEKL